MYGIIGKQNACIKREGPNFAARRSPKHGCNHSHPSTWPRPPDHFHHSEQLMLLIVCQTLSGRRLRHTVAQNSWVWGSATWICCAGGMRLPLPLYLLLTHWLYIYFRELTSTLPDRGAKLQERIRQIDLLLQDESLPDLEITPENTLQDRECALTRGFTSLSLHTPQQLTRRRIVAAENARARANSVSSSSLSRRASLCSNSRDGLAITALQRRMSSSCSISSAPPSSTSSSRSFTAEGSFVVDNQVQLILFTFRLEFTLTLQCSPKSVCWQSMNP